MKASDKQKTSIEIAGGLIKELKGLCQGVQIIPLGWEDLVPAFSTMSGYKKQCKLQNLTLYNLDTACMLHRSLCTFH